MKTLFTLLGILLAGYAFLDKGFAYFGVPPIFVSEIVLAVGVFILIAVIGVTAIPINATTILLVAFMIWGAACTLPHIGAHGLDAFRDGVVWGYAMFACIVAAAFARSGAYEAAFVRYGRILPWFIIWSPFAIATYVILKDSLPYFPGTDTTLLHLKAGDFGVHIGAAVAFLILGLHHSVSSVAQRQNRFDDRVLWGLAILAAIMVGSLNRGGFLAIIAAVFVVMATRPTSKMTQLGAVGALLLFVMLLLVDVDQDAGEERRISLGQIILNLQSVLGIVESHTLAGTVEWRLGWWEQIIDYTIFGKHFWFGKGFGINLAYDDNINLWFWGDPLRSPHNGHITILARAGVPGLALWVAFNAAYVWSLGRAYVAARRRGHDLLARINLWLVAYWAAFVVNMSFDVYLEGPQGGIWFWSVIGAGIAFAEHQRRMFASAEFTARPPAAPAAAAAE